MAKSLADLSPAGRNLVEKMMAARDLPEGSSERLQMEKTLLSDKRALGEVKNLAKDIHARFGNNQGGFDKDRLARTFDALPDDAGVRIRKTMSTVISVDKQAAIVKEHLTRAHERTRDRGHDHGHSYGLG